MTFIHIKRQQIRDETGNNREYFAVQAIAINGPEGKKLIPNPSGSEACLFETLEEAEAAVRRAGFDYVFEGKKTYLMDRPVSRRRPPVQYGPDAITQAVPLLIERLRDKESGVVASAAFALGELKDGSAAEPLTEILGHEDPAVRRAAAEAMARLGADAIGPLHAAFEATRGQRDKNPTHVRLTVMSAYLEMTHTHRELLGQVLPQVIEALEDESWLVRSQAAQVIGHAAQFFQDDRLPPKRP